MSQNLIGIAKKYKGKWYVFPETAEEVVGDKEKYIGPDDDTCLGENKYWIQLPKDQWKRILEITSNCTLGPYDSLQEAIEKSPTDFFDGYFEYGVSTSDYIDDIKLVLSYDGEEVKEDESIDEDPEIEALKQRIENLEDFMDTQTRINNKLLKMLLSLETSKSEREIKGERLSRCIQEKKQRTYEDYAKLCNKALGNGNIMQALRIAAETKLIPDKKILEEKFYTWVKKQNWNNKDGEYIIANWFEIQPMLPRDIDGKELKKENTLYGVLPLLTKKQAWAFIKANREDLETYFRYYN